MAVTKTKIGHADHGQKMILADFEFAETETGSADELGRGIIIVSEIANPWHALLLAAVRRQLTA